MFKIPTILKQSPAVETVVGDTSLKRFTFQPPIPLPLESSSAMEAPQKAQMTLYKKGQPLKASFSFQPPIPIPIPLESASAMEDCNKAHITRDGKEQPLEKRFSFQSPIAVPMPMDDSSALETSLITLDGKEQLLEELFSFQPPTPLPLEDTSSKEASDKARITLDENWQPLKERFSFQPPIPLPSDGISDMEASHKTQITLDEKEQPLGERFSFQPPIPLPLDGTSAMEVSQKARITLDGNGQPLEKHFIFQSLIPISSADSSALETSLNTLDGKGQFLEELFSFQSPTPTSLEDCSAMKASHNNGITQDDKGQPLQKRIIYQSPYSMPVASNKARIPLDEKGHFLEELSSFQTLSLDSRSALETPHKDEKKQPQEERFYSLSPIPIPLTSSSALEASHKDEKEQPVEERFYSLSRNPIPTTSSSALEASPSTRITLDEKAKPLEKPFDFQPTIPLPSNSRLAVDALLANNRLFEAFHKARITLDEEGQSLVEHFFRHCIEKNRFKVLADLCLNEDEEQMVYRLLQECGSRQAETVQLILLLQSNKYIEAVTFMESVSAKRKTPDDALKRLTSAYRSTMSPVTRGLADTYLSLHGKLRMGLENVPNAEHCRPLSSQLASQKPSDIKSCVFNTLLAENQVQEVHNNVPLLRTQHYGSSEMPQRLRTVRPVPYRRTNVGKRHSELKESDEEPSSKRFRFQPPSGGNDTAEKGEGPEAAEKGEGPEAAKKAGGGTDEKITDIGEAAKAKVSPPLKASSFGPQPRGIPHQDSPIDRSLQRSKRASFVTTPQQRRQKHKPLLEVIEEEGSLDILGRGPRLRTAQSTPSPKTVPSVPSEYQQSRFGRTARRQNYQLNVTNQFLEFHPRRHPI